MKSDLTDEQVELEIERLKKSPLVKLAQKEQRLKNAQKLAKRQSSLRGSGYIRFDGKKSTGRSCWRMGLHPKSWMSFQGSSEVILIRWRT